MVTWKIDVFEQTVVRIYDILKVDLVQLTIPTYLITIHTLNTITPATLLKRETPIQVLSGKFWEIFNNNLFYRTPLVAASEQFTILVVNYSTLATIWKFTSSVYSKP